MAYKAISTTGNYYDPDAIEKRGRELDVWKRKLKSKGVMGRFTIPMKEIVMRETEDDSELATYSIRLGYPVPYNIPQVQDDVIRGDYPIFRLGKLGKRSRIYKFPFSYRRDNFGSLQSEHCFFSGLMGQGKTNLTSLFLVDWHRRPNPTVSFFISQKGGVIDMDMQRIKKKLYWGGHESTLIRIGDEHPEGKIPFSILNPGDVKVLFNMGTTHYTKFYGIVQACKKVGDNITKAMRRFIETKEGERYKEIYYGMGNYFSTKRRDDLFFRRKWSYFLDISKLLRTESEATIDVVLSSWLTCLYQFITEQRGKISKEMQGSPEMYLHQYQALIAFDEYYELARGLKFKRLVNVVNRIAMQGRQDGMSLIISAQTVRGMATEKVAIDQASNLFQFKPSSNSDQNFAIKTMGWEKSNYELFVRELYNTAFPSISGNKDIFKGRTILFSKSNGDIVVLKLKLLE